MVISIKEAGEIRDRTHNLDLNDPEHYRIYEDSRDNYIKLNEVNDAKYRSSVHNDGKNLPTIGYGFNMQDPSARSVWNKVIGDKVSFDDAKAGKAEITEDQAEDLFQYKKDQGLEQLKKTYPDWDKFKPNEKIIIEDLFYNGGYGLVGSKTNFCKHANAYLKTSDPKHWDKALYEVKENSNKERYTNPEVAKGIQARRDAEEEAGASSRTPIRSLPNEDPIPEKPKTIHAKLNKTIIPRIISGNKDDDCTLSDRYYIWRAVEDYKTRDQHAANSGKIFDSHNPPPRGNAGEDYNCRCTADFNIPNWVKIEGTLNNKYIVRKYITDLTTLPNFVIKCGSRGLNFRS